MKKFTKNIVKEFKKSFGRFLAIMAIIALGVGFLIGISQSTPDMKTSMSDFLRANAAYDVDIKATYGLTSGDIQSIAEVKNDDGDKVVSSYMPVVTSSVMASIDGAKDSAVNIIGLDFSVVTATGAEDNENYLNHLTLIEGQFPAEGYRDEDGNEVPLSSQVVAERSNNYFAEVKPGDKVVIADNLNTANSTYGDIYAQKELTVVGVVSSPDYYYVDAREITTVGTGVVNLVVYGNYNPEDAENSVYDLSKEGTVFATLNADSFKVGPISVPVDPIRADKIIYTDLWVRIDGMENYEYFYDNDFVTGQAEFIAQLGDGINAQVNTAIDDFISKLSGMPAGIVPADVIEQLGQLAGGSSWYVLDRASTNVSYVSFDMNVEKVEDIAGVFPIFFIVVAALVALTSMTKMVEEDRMQIGTLKALGYSEGTIMSKYLIYCSLACIIGVVVGILLGFSIMPSIFWNAYKTMYYLPELYLGFSWWLALAVVFGSLALTIAVTVIACRATTKGKPSALMQPKAPKPGKRILLERCTPIWKRIKFKWKATIRNIFRYKKNMVLTIISVLGCTALILTGFGLGDSVEQVTVKQYDDIIFYDTIISHPAGYEYNAQGEGELDKYLASLDEGDYLDVYSENGQLEIAGEDSTSRESVDLYLVESDSFADFVSLHSRKSGKPLDTEADGIIIPENIAIVYDLSAGDSIKYVTADRVTLELKISGICEYYTGSQAYMSGANFRKAVEAAGGNADTSANTLLVKYGYGTDSEKMDSDAERLLADANVTGVEYTYTTISSFDALNETMSFVILILVVSAGALAAIVLYNLTNINIDERRKEIATLRVLGYSKWEVAGYIYRESSILTIVGALFGLLGGWLLHMFIVGRVNSVMMMFVKTILPLSYLWSFLITIGFAVVVYAFMLIKLYKIDMAESLKSNE